MLDADARPDQAGIAAVSPALAKAVRAAARFDRRAVSPSAGLLAAIPVVVLLGGGLALLNHAAAVTMAAGAMLVGIAWRVTGGRPPLVIMAADACVMALSTFVGSATGAHHWVHLALLCLWSLTGGLMVGVGSRGAVLGTQAIIALVVFGRFSEPPASALGLAGYVLAGGLAEVVLLSVLRWPAPLRAQRLATAAAYRALADAAAGGPDASALPAATALDDAQNALAGGALFGDPAILTLRALVNEGHRIRVHLSALNGLLRRFDGAGGGALAGEALGVTAAGLRAAADAMLGAEGAPAELDASAAELRALADGIPQRASDPLQLQLRRRLLALAGQLRAVAGLAPEAAQSGGLRRRGRRERANDPLADFRSGLAQMRANASLQSPAGRHALRLAVVVPAAEIIAHDLSLQRGYWLPIAAATVLRPEFGATFTRGTERAVGTAAGVALAGGIAVGLHPGLAATVAIVGVLAAAAYALFPATFAGGFAFITAVVVFLLNAVSPDTLSTASARLLDTLVGGALGLFVYAAWPTWSHGSARRALAELVGAQREYIAAVLGALAAGRRAREEDVRPQARRARVARTRAEAVVAASLSDPVRHRIDPRFSQAVMAALRRLVQSVHVLRLETQERREPGRLEALVPLAADLDAVLAIVQRRLAAEPDGPQAPEPLPDLRARYGAVERSLAGERELLPLLGELDEIVDAVNGLAALVGLDPGAEPEAPPEPATTGRS